MPFPVSVQRVAAAATLASSLFVVPAARAQVPPPPVTAQAWLLVDASANQVLASYNADQRVEPASLTKLMTTYLVFDALRAKKITLDQIITPTESVRRVGRDESRMFIEPNKPVSVHDLLHGMVTQSGNDAAIALAELLGGSESGFVTMMNAKAKQLGMTRTQFADVNGMPDPNHYTTAGDLATLSTHLIRDFPDYYPIFSEREFKYNNIRQPNRNRLLWLDPTVDGLKTGHTRAAGYCLIATAKRPLLNVPGASRRLVVVMMGEPKESARVQDSLKMLNYGYQAFDSLRLYQANQAIETPKVYKGKADTVKIGVLSDQYLTVPKGMGEKVKPVLVRTDPLIAPLKKGQQVGVVKVMGDDKELAQFPVVALEEVPEAGIVGRLWDSLMLMFQKKK
ncbi:D-alanyl-D-alanine carboxypeptidase family protein [Chitinasiproducens palmae]|uniref:serine-type D-Ala-D-Ala carboxypeptidase n=1 Tax=Chitinasiproducens palmae TaxID=1770053 RepID=A0A1H2PNR9_9BURK|nr:D-alanyl-D-alanine carboxypeptidase family protein [Chitinasiproducens palmae]SDV48357.1 penicillin-binding protein 6. Serine peptidase. MEROPS family S11 [Chitinasiproducens palmae]